MRVNDCYKVYFNHIGFGVGRDCGCNEFYKRGLQRNTRIFEAAGDHNLCCVYRQAY